MAPRDRTERGEASTDAKAEADRNEAASTRGPSSWAGHARRCLLPLSDRPSSHETTRPESPPLASCVWASIACQTSRVSLANSSATSVQHNVASEMRRSNNSTCRRISAYLASALSKGAALSSCLWRIVSSMLRCMSGRRFDKVASNASKYSSCNAEVFLMLRSNASIRSASTDTEACGLSCARSPESTSAGSLGADALGGHAIVATPLAALSA
mmetsp:Transcript_56517/g.163918  ORF Transcript_56517/g.163918 Transcript_56517/m.163918 type:complete len:214 (+) Transcript_56517:425-1066(+)